MNVVQRAIEGASKLSQAEQDAHIRTSRDAFDAFRRAENPEANWRALADAFNLAEHMSAQGLCSDEASKTSIRQAQSALGAVLHRFEHLGTWTLKAHEMLDMEEGLLRFRIQVRHCSQREFRTAIDRVREITSQALAGNAPKGVEVIEPPRAKKSA